MKLMGEFKGLTFTQAQLFLSGEECAAVAKDFWGTSSIGADQFTDRDRAFIQAALLIAIDKSEKAGYLFDVWSSFMSATPSRSVQKLVKDLAKRTAKRWFKSIIDDTPKISAVGKSAIQYSQFTSEWRVRVGTGDSSMLLGTGDSSMLSNFLSR